MSVTSWPAAWSSEAPLPRGSATLEEWGALSEDQAGELVDGTLTEEEVPDPVHELAVTLLVLFFGNHLLPRGGFVFASEVKLAVLPSRGRKADVSAYFPGGHRPPKRGLLRAPPDLLVEVITPTPRDERRDRVEKMAEYQAFGVRFYWLVDPALGSVEVFELREGVYAKLAGVTSGSIAVPGCEGLVFDVDAFWAQLAELGPESSA
jgi:Uma2 family endonuclease